jgi:vacuolar iron transporter family protein
MRDQQGPVMTAGDARLGRRLVLDEISDLSLYRALHHVAPAGLRRTLEALIPVETRHVAFWQKFFGLERLTRLDFGRRLRLAVIVLACRLFGATAIHIVLEAIEVHGVKKYLDVWRRYGDGPLGAAVREVLADEFQHEDRLVSGEGERRISPEKVRNVFLGLNDGLVEILGAMSGFFAAFSSTAAIVTAGFTVGVAGALSMAAGAYIGAGSEAELRDTEDARRRFMGETVTGTEAESPLASAAVVGIGYFVGAGTVWPTVVTGGLMILAVSAIVAFISGMDVRRRIARNVVVTGIAVAVTYALGLLTKHVLGARI